MDPILKHVSFKNGGIEIAGDLHLPGNFRPEIRYPAVVLVTPGSSVKGQIGAVYASRLARHGFVALAFDPSYQGESGGEPRDLENPAMRIEDVRCAVDYLVTLPYVDDERLGLLGICAGGGYAASAAMIERRFKALATVVASNMGRAFRQMEAKPGAVSQILAAVGRQRTLEARGGQVRRDNWVPDTLAEARDAGRTDRDLLDAVEYYRTPRGFDPHSTNRLLFRGMGSILAFDAFHMASQLLVQPLLVVVGGRLGTTFSFEDGKTLFELAPNRKEFHVVAGAGHYDLYDKPEYVDEAVEKLVAFYRSFLGDNP